VSLLECSDEECPISTIHVFRHWISGVTTAEAIEAPDRPKQRFLDRQCQLPQLLRQR